MTIHNVELELILLVSSVATLEVYYKDMINMNMSTQFTTVGWAIWVEGGLPTPSNVVMGL